MKIKLKLPKLRREHSQNLKESGLNDRTIELEGFHSVSVAEVEARLGRSLAGVKSAYRLPYRFFDDYPRYRVFPPFVGPDGKPRKYLQPDESAPHIYFHSLFPKETFSDPSVPIYLVEGEKKTLALVQQGILNAIGFAGVWGWSKGKALLPDFDLISWQGRRVIIIPDSDIWLNQRSKEAIYALCRDLQERGARPSIVVLPPQCKGADDYLLGHSLNEFLKLEAVSLNDGRFEGLDRWYEEREKRNKGGLLSLIPPSAKKWVSPLREKAYYGLAGQFVRLIEPHTEADPVALLGQFLVGFGNLIGRKAHFTAEGSKHFFNLYIIVIGQTAKGRKGSAWSQVRRFFELADPVWHNERIKSGLSSGEGLIWAVRDAIESQKLSRKTNKIIFVQDDPGVKDKRLLVYESELALVLNIMRRDGNILTAVLRDLWDGRIVVECLTKNNPAKTTCAHISIVAHVTEEELKLLFRPTDARNGFGNRFLWICAKRTKLLPDGGNPSKLDLIKLSAKLRGAIRFSKNVDEMQRDAEAAQLWREVYPFLSKERPGIFGGLIGRAEPQVMRIAGIYALLDLSRVIRKPHLEAALAFWDYAENSLLYLYGDSLGDEAANKIVKGLRKNAPGGMTLSEIGDKLFSNHYDPVSIQLTLSYLVSAGFITARERKTQGRPAQEFFATSEGVR